MMAAHVAHPPVSLEICVDSVEGALAAQAGGAHRVELCDNLLEGGTTPSAGMIALTRQQITIGLQVIIRPRGGDFCYSDLEFAVMKADVLQAKQLGADGVVIGLLNPDGTIDQERTAELIALARPLSVTFHRAFDMVADPLQALEDLVGLGVERVLTSGLESSALEGVDLINALVQRAGDRIIVMAGGGVHERNLAKIINHGGVREIHLSARGTVESAMHYRNRHVFMGGALRPPEFSRQTTDRTRVQAIVDRINS
ncbi:MAG: copper homeostasis protein CutC [Caldilineaceae bacterium]|nr:copper homeostasis protein CutC [Caldilineaceae bacterium]